MWLLQALEDNRLELEQLRALAKPASFRPVEGYAEANGGCGKTAASKPPSLLVDPANTTPSGVLWTVPGALGDGENSAPESDSKWGVDVIDNMAHGHTTAHLAVTQAQHLGLSAHLRIHARDAFKYARMTPEVSVWAHTSVTNTEIR